MTIIGSLRFAGDLAPTLVIGFACLAAIAVVWLYLRESRSVASPYNYLLPALRASAVALVILILAGPVWHRRKIVGTLGRVIFAVDVSASMSISDSAAAASSPTRLDRALHLLTGRDATPGWLETLQKTHAVDVLAFSSGVPSIVWSSRDNHKPVPTSLEMSATGRRTDVSAGIAAALASMPRRGQSESTDDDGTSPHRAALVVLSDGRDNEGPSPVDLAEQLKSAGAEVHTIGMGSEDEPTDVAIAGVECPDSVAADGMIAGKIDLKQFGIEGRELDVRIESGTSGEVFWQKTVTASPTHEQIVPFELDVETLLQKISRELPRGVHRSTVVIDLRAAVEPVDGDTSLQNNSLPFRVAASTRDRRLLILDGSSRWEMRYLRNLFSRDPAWSVDTVLYGPGTDTARIKRGSQPGQFPNTREGIAAYDAIILGEVPPEQFEFQDAELLRQFVTRGGGLIVIDGRYDRLKTIADESLTELIPVKYLESESPIEPKFIRPTRLAMELPVFNLWNDNPQLAELWKKLPAPSSALAVRAQEGAEIWADAVAEDGRQYPWLVTRLFGAGRVVYFSSDQTWRWRYKVADRFHARFWNQLLAAVMQPPYAASDDYVALGTDKIEYEVGDSSTVRVRLQDTSGKPVGDATVDALLISDNRVVATIPLSSEDPARGTYQGQTPPLAMGAYDVRIRASGFDATALQATTPIWVGTRDTIELTRVSLDKNALVQVAQSGGGIYLHESSADQILDQLRPLSSGIIVESDIMVWQSFYWFWTVVVLLAIEWWLRKQAGLV